MLKVLFNEKTNSNLELKLTLNSFMLSAETNSFDIGFHGHDTIENLFSYNSYALIDHTAMVKIYRQIQKSDCKFIDLCRLGFDNHLDFAKIILLFGKSSLIQVDTGMISTQEKDIIIRVFYGTANNTEIISDIPYEIGTFNSDDLVNGDHPRENLWDSYSLSITGREEWEANKKGIYVKEPISVIIPSNREYIDFTINKYQGKFVKKLTRNIDDEEVFIDSSAGLVVNRRVPLENGVGTFRLYLFGHTGPIKIKLGRRWYRVWNEYNLIVR